MKGELLKIEPDIEHLNFLKDAVVSTYAECCALSYNQCRDSNITFDNEQFINDVDKALALEAMRGFSETQIRKAVMLQSHPVVDV